MLYLSKATINKYFLCANILLLLLLYLIIFLENLQIPTIIKAKYYLSEKCIINY